MHQIEQFAIYLQSYSEDFAIEQIDRLDRILRFNLAEAPLTWSYFPLTGAPYRAYLFRVGRRTQYCIIYTVEDDARTVDILQFWNAIRDPYSLQLQSTRFKLFIESAICLNDGPVAQPDRAAVS